MAAARERIVSELVAVDPSHIPIIERDKHFRPVAKISGTPVSINVCRCVTTADGERWILQPALREQKLIALIARLTPDNGDVVDLHVVVGIPFRSRHSFVLDDAWLRKSKRLNSLADISAVIDTLKV